MSGIRIYKYRIKDIKAMDGTGNLILPTGSKIIKVGIQDNQWCLWAEVNSALGPQDCEARMVLILGTGAQLIIPPSRIAKHIETVFHEHLVWHIYEMVSV